jgi:small subunit ribosomal protein S6
MSVRKYECVMVLHPGSTAEETQAIHERFVETVKKHGGEIQSADDWGMRRLEYDIEKQTSAHYWFFKFTADNTLVPEADRDMRLDDKVIRHLIVLDEEWADQNRVAQAKRNKDVAEEEAHGS